VANHLPAEIEILDSFDGEAPGLTLRGEIDIATSPQLERTLDEVIRASTGAFVLDLCDVSFVDGSGLTVLLRARAALAREGRALAIVCPRGPGPVRRVMELAGVEDLLSVHAPDAGCGGPRRLRLRERATASPTSSRQPSGVPSLPLFTGVATRLA